MGVTIVDKFFEIKALNHGIKLFHFWVICDIFLFILFFDDAIFVFDFKTRVDGIGSGDACEGRGDFLFDVLILFIFIMG